MPNLSGMATGIPGEFYQRHYRAYFCNGRNRMRKYDGENWRNSGIAPWRWAITRTALTTNVVTITTSSAHGLTTSSDVKIDVLTRPDAYNGTYAVASVPTSTTFTYARTNSNISAADNGGYATFVPRATASGTGLSGRYRYIVVPVNENHVNSDGLPIMGLPTAISSEILLANTGASVAGIPSTHADAQVTHWWLFRNKADRYDGTIEDEVQDFWRVASVAIGTTSYVDADGAGTTATIDDALPPITCSFRANIPPTFKFGAIYGDRLFGAGFDEYTTGTATVNSVTTLIDFSSATLPDGIEGCYFQKVDDEFIYTIAERPTTSQVCLDRPFSGSLSAASFRIFRDPSEVWFSEFDSFDAWGLDSEFLRNRLRVGGAGARRAVTGMVPLNGSLWVFTLDQIYRIYGKGPDQLAIKISPDPVFDGLGAVSHRSIVTIDNECYFMSLQGPCVFDGVSPPRRIGDQLGTAWLDDLNASQLALAASGTDGRRIWFSLPKTSQTENGLTYRYDRFTQTWWQEDYTHPTVYLYDLDANGKPAAFYAQGKFIVQAATGTNDGVPSGTTSGTATSSTTTTLTDSGAAFYTTGSGLAERYVHIFEADSGGLPGAFVGSRRLASNTATVLTWSSSGAGGGTLTVPASAKYYVGPTYWYWKSKTYQMPQGNTKQAREMTINLELQGESTTSDLILTEYRNGTALTNLHIIDADRVSKQHPLDVANDDYAVRVECRDVGNQIAIRDIIVDERPRGDNK